MTKLRGFYDGINQAINFRSAEYSENDGYAVFIVENTEMLSSVISVMSLNLSQFPSLTLDIERCERGHKIIVYHKEKGTKLHFNYANKRLDRINRRGNGILVYVVTDGLVESVCESLSEESNDFVLTVKVLRELLILGTMEQCFKRTKRN
jgi:hypothetical protein